MCSRVLEGALRQTRGAGRNATVAFALGTAVALRLPTFRYPLVSDDEAIYDAMAQVIVRGGTMYRETVDHKPPGLVYTYSVVRAVVTSLGGSFAAVMEGVHVFGVVTVVLTCLALHAIARECLSPRLAQVPPLLYAIASATSVPPDSLAVNGELLMNLPTAAAVALALRATRPASTQKDVRKNATAARFTLLSLAGSLVGVAALYKYQAVLVGVALLVLIASPRDRPSPWMRRFVVDGVALAVGLALPFAGAAIFFESRGALTDAVRWGLLFNTHYLQEGPDIAIAAKRLGMQLLGVVLPNGIVYGGGAYGAWLLVHGRRSAEVSASHGVARGRLLLLVWAAGALYAVTLGRRFFGHYFLQPLLPLTLLAAGPVAQLWDALPRLTAAALGAPAFAFFCIAVVPEATARLVYAADPDTVAIGGAVAARSSPGDTIWVWGNVPQIYFTAARAPGVRFTFCNYLTGLSPGSRSELDPTFDSRRNAVPGAWDMVVHDLDEERPTVIVDTAAAGMKSYGKYPVATFPVLARYLAAHYRLDGNVLGASLYRRVDAHAPSH